MSELYKSLLYNILPTVKYIIREQIFVTAEPAWEIAK